jgi:hypothetical protein
MPGVESGAIPLHGRLTADVKITEPIIVARKIDPARRRAAGKRIAANIRRLQKSRGSRMAVQALAEARGERLAG